MIYRQFKKNSSKLGLLMISLMGIVGSSVGQASDCVSTHYQNSWFNIIRVRGPITCEENRNVELIGNRFNAHVFQVTDGADVTINGNLKSHATAYGGRWLRAIYMGAYDLRTGLASKATINGNVDLFVDRRGGQALEISDTNKDTELRITGDLTIRGRSYEKSAEYSQEGIGLGGGKIYVGGNTYVDQMFAVEADGFEVSALNIGSTEGIFKKNLTITTNSDKGIGLDGGAIAGAGITVEGDLNVQTESKNGRDSKQIGVDLVGGILNILGKAQIKAKDNVEGKKTPHAFLLSERAKIAGVTFASGQKSALERATAKILLGSGSEVLTEGLDADTILLKNAVNIDKVLINNKGILSAKNAHVINAQAMKFKPNRIIEVHNSGVMEAPKTDARHLFLGGDNREILTSEGFLHGNISMGKGNDNVVLNGGAINGKIFMGDGDDLAMFSNTNLSELYEVDGGAKALSVKQGNNFLLNQSLSGSTFSRGSANNTRITNWDNISIGTGPDSVTSLGYRGTGDAGTLNLTGGLFSLNGIGRMHIGNLGTLALQSQNAASDYHTTVEANGRIDLTGGSVQPGAQLVIRGSYFGHPGSELHIKSSWNNPDVQQNDQLTIRGNAHGKTRVWVPNGILGDVTASEVEKNGGLRSPVVTVEGNHENMNFLGVAQTANAGEAQLKKVGNRWYWTLQAVESVKEIVKNNDLEPEAVQLKPAEIKPIYNPSVPSYVQLPYINREMGLSQLGRLHQRIGDSKSEPQSDTKSEEQNTYHRQAWARFSLDSLQLQGATRLGSKVRSGFAQFGHDLRFHYQEGKESYTGVMVSYGWANSSFYDKYRSESGIISANKYTSSTKSELFSLGGYHTIYYPNDIYLDAVGQFSLIKNRYQNDQTARLSQMGYMLSAGLELGKSFILTETMNIEPQAQLIYQWQKLNKLNDSYRQIKADDQQSLIGRAGVRLAWHRDTEKKPNLYLEANLLQRFKGERSQATIGREKVSERYARSHAEIGIGGQYALTKKLSLYGDAQYRFSLDSNGNSIYRQSSQSKNSYNARVGIKYSW